MPSRKWQKLLRHFMMRKVVAESRPSSKRAEVSQHSAPADVGVL